MKTFLKILGGIVVLLIALLIGLSLYFNSSRLKKMVVPRLQSAIGRPVNIQHMSLSFFETFPNPAIEIDQLSVPGKAKTDTLLSLDQLAIGVKLFPLLSQRVVITELDLDEPTLTYIVYPDSSTNFDFLFKDSDSTTDTTASSGYDISIPHFSISDGHLKYIDYTTHTRVLINNLDGTLSLSYADSISSQIHLSIGQLGASQNGERFISGLPVSLREKSTLYPNKELLKLNNGYFSIHGLKLNLSGLIKNWTTTPAVNLHIQSSSKDFGELLKLLPASFDDYTKELQTKGSLALQGTIKGKITEEKVPHFNIKMAVKNGFIKDPDLPQPIKNIRLIAHATNHLLTIDTLHAIAGNNKLSGSAQLKNPLEDNGAFQASFLADVDLSTVHQFYDLSQMDIDKLSGQLHADANIQGHLDQLDDILFNGKAVLSNGLIKYEGIPKALSPINININGSQNVLHIQRFELNAGKNSISAEGTIQNIADETSRRIDLNLRMHADLATLQKYYPINDSLQLKGILSANIKLRGSAKNIEEAIQDGQFSLKDAAITGKTVPHPITNLNIKLQLSPSKATLNTFKAKIGSSDINIHGSLTHYLALLKGENESKVTPTLVGHFSSHSLNLDKLMSESEADTASFYPQLPDLNTKLSANIEQLTIAGMTLRNLNVHAETTPKQVHLSQASVQLFNGKASGVMTWTIPEGQPSTFHFKGSLDSLQLKSFFRQFPILGEDSQFYKYISGSFSAQADYTTKLDTTLHPIIATSSLKSTFGMGKAQVKGYPIQKELAEFTHLDILKNLTLDSWTSHLSIKDKILTIKNLSITSNNIGIEVNGTEQLLTGLMDFHISLHLPQKLDDALGSLLNGHVASLLTQPDGGILIPLQLSGQYNNPSIKLDKSFIKTQLKKKGKHKIKNTVKNLFNRLTNRPDKDDTTKASHSTPAQDSSSAKPTSKP